VQQQRVEPGERSRQRGPGDDHALGGEAELGHRGDRVDAVSGDVADHEEGVPVGQFDGAEPVTADVGARLGGQIGDFDAQPRQAHRAGGQGEQGVLQPAGQCPLGAQHVVLAQDGPLALDEGELRAALRGEVLYDAVHLDGPADGVRHGLGDGPQMPQPVRRPDAERDVERAAPAQEFADGTGQRGHVLGQGQAGQVGEADRAFAGVAVEELEDL